MHLEGPYKLGKFSLPLNIIGFLFLLFASITFNFPQGKPVLNAERQDRDSMLMTSFLEVNPVNKDNMNYTSAALGVIGLISLVTWITTGRRKFTGPNIDGVKTDIDRNSTNIIHEKGDFSSDKNDEVQEV